MTVIGVKRASKYSPNHINNDLAIFELVQDHLEQAGIQVNAYADEFIGTTTLNNQPDLVFTMSRNPVVLETLKKLEMETGVTVVNSAFGIENCFRSNITNILLNNQIPTSPSRIIPTTGFQELDLEELDKGAGLWLKRGDFHAIQKEDVVFAKNATQAKSLLKDFASRGISEVVVSEHLKGDLIKFYGVAGTDFFHWLYPFDKNHYKYQEFKTINGPTNYYPFDLSALQAVADKIATIAGVPIYGGDAVVDQQGNMFIIDFNDWPSFAPCREMAAKRIASYITDLVQQKTTTNSKTINS